MNVEELFNRIDFKDDNERCEALFYVNMKGIYLHSLIVDYLLKDNNKTKVSWKQVSDELRNDKGLRDTLYIYLATLEEYIRAYISNKYENDVNQSFWISGNKRNDIRGNIEKGTPLFVVLQDTDLGTIIEQVKALPQEDRNELFGLVGTDENLLAVKELRNCVGHHKFLKIYKFKKCIVDGCQSDSLENNIKNLRQLLPEEYRYGKNGRGGITAEIKRYKITMDQDYEKM